MAEFVRRVVTYRLYSKLLDLEQALNGNNENLVQRELGKLHEALEYNSEKVAEYFEESLVAEENSDKQNLINCLRFVGAPDKDDGVYLYDWERLLEALHRSNIISKDTFLEIMGKLNEKWKENEFVGGYLEG